jgi:O-antigen/teichoic acid export membrane protein
MVSAIVMPMGARLLQESEEVLARTIQKTNRLMIMITVPIAIMITLNADLIVSILFRGDYGPSVNIIRIQSPIIPLTYFNTISGTHLMQLGGIRHQVKIALICCLTKAVLSPLLILLGMKYFDSGGLAIAVSNVLTECLSALLLTFWLRKYRPGDSQLVNTAVRLLVVFLLVGGIHLFAAKLGYFVLLVDIAVYAVIASALKVMPIREFVELLKKGRRR